MFIIDGLKVVGLCREVHHDRLIWYEKMKSANVVVAYIYDKLCEVEGGYVVNPMLYDSWKCHVPCKIIFFTWLVFHNKNLTWENLRKCQWHGPSIYVICKQEEENNAHLFLTCQHVSKVWFKLAAYYDFPHFQFQNVSDCLRWWLKQKLAWRNIPLFLFWTIWKWRNKRIFEDCFEDFGVTYDKIISLMALYPAKETIQKHMKMKKSVAPPMVYPTAFFDEASQNQICGCGIWLVMSLDL